MATLSCTYLYSYACIHSRELAALTHESAVAHDGLTDTRTETSELAVKLI